MREDIEIHINTGDMTLSPRNRFELYPFTWVDNLGGLSRYIYGEITIPATISEARIKANGIHINIPYTPIYKEFCIRIKRQRSEEIYAYMRNPTHGTEWFVVKAAKHGKQFENIYASELMTISETSFYIRLNKDVAELYAGSESDMKIITANHQNANLLLKCVPTNCYRYPLTGIGLIMWSKGNINQSELADILQREFEGDGVRVNNASFDFETNDLYLDLDTRNTE